MNDGGIPVLYSFHSAESFAMEEDPLLDRFVVVVYPFREDKEHYIVAMDVLKQYEVQAIKGKMSVEAAQQLLTRQIAQDGYVLVRELPNDISMRLLHRK